jgi:hypothetical protein
MSGLLSQIKTLKLQTAEGLEIPLQFRERIFMNLWGTQKGPLKQFVDITCTNSDHLFPFSSYEDKVRFRCVC